MPKFTEEEFKDKYQKTVSVLGEARGSAAIKKMMADGNIEIDKSFSDSAKEVGLDVLDYTMRGLDYAGGLVRGTLGGAAEMATGKDLGVEFQDVIKGKAPSTSQMMEKGGVPEGPSVDLNPWWDGETSVRDAVGFVGDMVTDPTNLVGGAGVLGRIGSTIGGKSLAKKMYKGVKGESKSKLRSIVALGGASLIKPSSPAYKSGKMMYESGLASIDEAVKKIGKGDMAFTKVANKYGLNGSYKKVLEDTQDLGSTLRDFRDDVLSHSDMARQQTIQKLGKQLPDEDGVLTKLFDEATEKYNSGSKNVTQLNAESSYMNNKGAFDEYNRVKETFNRVEAVDPRVAFKDLLEKVSDGNGNIDLTKIIKDPVKGRLTGSYAGEYGKKILSEITESVKAGPMTLVEADKFKANIYKSVQKFTHDPSFDAHRSAYLDLAKSLDEEIYRVYSAYPVDAGKFLTNSTSTHFEKTAEGVISKLGINTRASNKITPAQLKEGTSDLGVVLSSRKALGKETLYSERTGQMTPIDGILAVYNPAALVLKKGIEHSRSAGTRLSVGSKLMSLADTNLQKFPGRVDMDKWGQKMVDFKKPISDVNMPWSTLDATIKKGARDTRPHAEQASDSYEASNTEKRKYPLGR